MLCVVDVTDPPTHMAAWNNIAHPHDNKSKEENKTAAWGCETG